MDVERLPDYPSFSLAMEESRYPTHLPDSQLHGYHQCELCSLPAPVLDDSQLAIDVPVDEQGDQSPLEDAQLILGRSVNFTIVADDDAFDAQEVVEELSRAPNNTGSPITKICVPRNKVASFHEALRECLVRRSQRVVERAGQVAFWRGREPFMRPVLSRSLSLP